MSAHRWIWHGFTASRQKHDGTVEEQKFTSEAQARQFVEKNNQEGPLAFRTSTPTKPNELRKMRNHKPIAKNRLTPEQQKLRDDAMAQFKGL